MDLGLAGRSLRRHRRQPRHRPRDGATALRRGRQRAAGRPRRGAAARRRPRRSRPPAAARRPGRALDARRHRGRRRATMLAAAEQDFGSLDVLVNNAGAASWRDLDDVPDEDWRAAYELNVMAPLRLMRAAIPAMAERGWGRVVNVCSTAGKRPSGGDARVLGREGGRALALAPVRRPPRRRAACSSTRSAPGRSNRRCGWSPAACSTSRSRSPGAASREEALATAGVEAPDRPPRRGRRDRRRDRLPLLRARLLRRRRRLVGRRRHRPGDHLTAGAFSRYDDDKAPGDLAERLLTPGGGARDGDPRADVDAAVLLPLFGWPEEPGLIFTERRADLRRHAGEISFPGGRRDEGDADLPPTALREAEEEIGLDPAAVELGGALPPTSTFVTGYRDPPLRRPRPRTRGARPRAQPDRGRDGPHLLARACCARATRCAAWSAAASRSTPRPTRSKGS